MTALPEVLEKLEPCPGCGAEVDQDECPYPSGARKSVDGRAMYAVNCVNNECGWQAWGWGAEGARKAWNTRHQPALLRDAGDGAAILAAMNDGYTVRKGLPSAYLTDEGNAEFAWIVERALPPFCDKKGVGMWHASTPSEVIAKARAAIDAAMHAPGGAMSTGKE